MKKDECERAVRSLCHEWRTVKGLSATTTYDLNIADCMSWIKRNHPEFFKFRSTMGADDTVEMWIADEFRQRSKY